MKTDTATGTLQIQESFVNATRGVRFGDSEWYEPYTNDLGELYRSLRREYGRCASRVYIDTRDGQTRAIGWVFVKRMEYEDAHRMRPGAERTYLREVWVQYRYVPEAEEAQP